VHAVLAAISLVLGTAIGWLGWRGLRAHRLAHRTDPVGEAEARERQAVR
jgi:hypothetical protein